MVSSMIVSLHSEQGKPFKVTVILLNMLPGTSFFSCVQVGQVLKEGEAGVPFSLTATK